ncbi:hypothetical protein CRUP_026453 [Coryphaenoides rupestris]|nr:hypothetical protein CRUP_026453 [Coryphaenoides rupestris]
MATPHHNNENSIFHHREKNKRGFGRGSEEEEEEEEEEEVAMKSFCSDKPDAAFVTAAQFRLRRRKGELTFQPFLLILIIIIIIIISRYTPNTGPSGDRSGSKQGFYMYIETSRPRKEGDQARLISPFFNVAPKSPDR